MKSFESKVISVINWKHRGDNYHWDHADGSFIELEGCALAPQKTDRYVLYSPDCARLASVRNFSDAVAKHAEMAVTA